MELPNPLVASAARMWNFQFSLDVWDTSGENVLERIAGINDLEIATAAYRAAITRWPQSRVILRQGARTVHDSGLRAVIA